MHILLVEESKLISNSLKSIFEDYGYLVDEYSLKKFAVLHGSLNNFDILIINIDVKSDIAQIRKKNPNLCVVGLNTSKNWSGKIKLLKSGFDDVLDYPFPAQEILIRVQNILKRPRNTAGIRLKVENLEMDLDGKKVLNGKEEIKLRRKEFCLLEYLIRNKNRTVSRNELLDHVWDYRKINNSNTVDVHIKRLRDKIQNNNIIQTIHGFGYRLNDKKKPKRFEEEEYLEDIS